MSAYKPKYGKLSALDRDLLGTGDIRGLKKVGYVELSFKHGQNLVNGKVYVVRNTPKLLLGIPSVLP